MPNLNLKKIFSVTVIALSVFSCSLNNEKKNISVLDIKKVAVFPFRNMTDYKDAGEIVSKVFVSELHNVGNFIVEEPANVNRFIVQENIYAVGELDIGRARVLGRRLKTDYILFGTIEEYGMDRTLGTPVLSLSVRLVDTEKGKVYWYEHAKKYGSDYTIIFDFGEIYSESALTKKVAHEMIKTIK